MRAEATDWPLVSVCIPVKNGGGRLSKCLQSLHDLDYPSDKVEIIIADGRSTDDTVSVAKSFGCTVLDNPNQIVASGRNISFGAAKGEFIASTDDDCVVPGDWIKSALANFSDPTVGAVGGISLLPETASAWPRAANFVFRLASGSGYSVQSDRLPDGEVDDLPGCNTFYRSAAFRDVGPFDEALVTAEDVDFHQRMRGRGFGLRASSQLFVWHDKRPTPSGLVRQMRRFAEGRVQLGRKDPRALRPMHRLLGWSLMIGLAAAAMAIAVLPPVALPVAVLLLWAIIAGKALQGKETLPVAILAGPATAAVALGWSWGYLKETFFPMASTKGR